MGIIKKKCVSPRSTLLKAVYFEALLYLELFKNCTKQGIVLSETILSETIRSRDSLYLHPVANTVKPSVDSGEMIMPA